MEEKKEKKSFTQAEVDHFQKKLREAWEIICLMKLLAENKTIANKNFKNKCKDLSIEFQRRNIFLYQKPNLVKLSTVDIDGIEKTIYFGEIPKEKVNVEAIIELVNIFLRALKNKQAKTKNNKNMSDLLFNEINDFIVQTYINICICMLNINSDEIEQKNNLLASLVDLLSNSELTNIVIESKCKKIVEDYLVALLNCAFANKFFYLSDIQKSNFGNTLERLFQCNQTNKFQMVFLNILYNLAAFISYKPTETEPQEYSNITLGQDLETFIINTLSKIISNKSLNQQIFNINNKQASAYYVRTLVTLTRRFAKFKNKKNRETLLNCINELFTNKNFIAVLENNDLCHLFFAAIFNFIVDWKSLKKNQQETVIKFMTMSIKNKVLNKNLLMVKADFEMYFKVLQQMCRNTKFNTTNSFLFTNLIFTLFANGYLKQFPPSKNNLPAQINNIKSNNIIINSLSDTLPNYLDNKQINVCLEILNKAMRTNFLNKKDKLSTEDLDKFLYAVLKIFDIISNMDYIFNTEIENVDKDRTIYLYVNLLCSISELAKSRYVGDGCRSKVLLLVENILNAQKFKSIKTAVFYEKNNDKLSINLYIIQIFSNLLYFQKIKGTNRNIKNQLIKLFSLILKDEQICEYILFPQDNIDKHYKNYNFDDIELWKNMLEIIKDKSENEGKRATETINILAIMSELYKKTLSKETKPLFFDYLNPSQTFNVNIKNNSMRLSEKSIFVRSLDKENVNNNLKLVKQPTMHKSNFKEQHK